MNFPDNYGVRAVLRHGKKIGLAIVSRDPPKKDGYRLVALLSNFSRAIAKDVTDPGTYGTYRDAMRTESTFTRSDLYWLDEKLAHQCPDEGRVMLSEIKLD